MCKEIDKVYLGDNKAYNIIDKGNVQLTYLMEVHYY